MNQLKVYIGKDGDPNLMISDNPGQVGSLFFLKKFIDGQMKDSKPKGFTIQEFYDMKNLELQNLTISIETENGKEIGLVHEPYDPKFRFKYDTVKMEMVFPDLIMYHTRVSKDGKVHSRKLLKHLD